MPRHGMKDPSLPCHGIVLPFFLRLLLLGIIILFHGLGHGNCKLLPFRRCHFRKLFLEFLSSFTFCVCLPFRFFFFLVFRLVRGFVLLLLLPTHGLEMPHFFTSIAFLVEGLTMLLPGCKVVPLLVMGVSATMGAGGLVLLPLPGSSTSCPTSPRSSTTSCSTP